MGCFRLLTLFAKHSTLDVWQGSENAFGLLKLFCHGLQRDTLKCLIYAKLIILFTNNFPFFLNSYMEVQNSSKQKVNKDHRKKINYSISCFWYFFHFLHTNVLENKYNKQKWHMLFFTCIKSVAHKLPCADLIACIKWKRLQTRSKHVK